MSTTKRDSRGTQDWKSTLDRLRTDTIRRFQTYKSKQLQALINRNKLNELKPELYFFLASYTQNSGIFINNFFRKRSFSLYEEDKFHDFDFDVCGIPSNVFDDPAFSMNMVVYFRKLEKLKVAYFPIDVEIIRELKVFSDALDYAPRIEVPTILYRGCSTIERNGVNGIVSTTTNYDIAKQFSRGTLLEIHVPEGTKCLDVKSIRPKSQRQQDKENEILLPPCDYTVVSEKVVKKQREPNNRHSTTTILEITVQPLNLLEEFFKVMENPIQEYRDKVMFVQKDDYEQALILLKDYIRNSQKQS